MTGFRPKKFYDEQSLVSKGEEAEIRLETLLDILENRLYAEQYYEILGELNGEVTPKLRARHLEIKQQRKANREEIKCLDEKIKKERYGRGTDWK